MNKFRTTIAILTATLVLAGCGSANGIYAMKEAADGNVINNEIMSAIYPKTFIPGHPAYLERDFEAGADFICHEIMRTRGIDICSEDDINWR